MGRIRGRLPSPALVVAIIALAVALAGSSAYAGSKLTLRALSTEAKDRTVGVGKITYVSSFTNVPINATTGIDVAAFCPAGAHVIGGGIRVGSDGVELVNDSHPTSNGWGGTVFNAGTVVHGATVTAICAESRSVSGALAP